MNTKQSLIYSQALRYNMLTNDDATLQVQLNFLTKALLAKAYPLDIIVEQIMKAVGLSVKEQR